MPELITIFELMAIAVFAISGALAAAERKLDILSFLLFGTVTGIGGGTLRDVFLDATPIFWIGDTRHLWVCLIASAMTWFLASRLNSRDKVLLWADAMGLALFSVLGTIKALSFDIPITVAIVLGTITATFGSLLRDTLLNRDPVLLHPEVYVTAAALGAVVYALLSQLLGMDELALFAGIIASFGLRAGAILFGWSLPGYRGNIKE